MPPLDRPALGLDAIATFTETDPGLIANVYPIDIQGGAEAARVMNGVIEAALAGTGANADQKIDAADMQAMSDFIRADAALYQTFVEAHGDDDGNLETGFHLVQGDGGAYRFQGRQFVDTVADAIYHIGFKIVDGRFQNEDGDQNERVEDVAGWLNYFLNGENIVYGDAGDNRLSSGHYSFDLDAALHEVFEAGDGNDKISAGLGDDIVFAGSGNDTAGGDEGDDHLMGEGGNDRLWGEDGNDLIEGGNGDDLMGGGTGEDVLRGGNGHDKGWGDEGDDVLDGGTGNDELGGEEGDDTLLGGDGDDRLWGQEGNDGLRGQAGNDRIGGGDGNDNGWGGLGDDKLTGEAGNDMLHGGDGADEAWGGGGADTIYGGTGNDKLGGQNGDDILRGGAGDDLLLGGHGRDTLYGQAGNDDLRGEGGTDFMYGGTGDDTLYGGDGRDRYIGGEGADTLSDWESVDLRDVFMFRAGHSGLTAATMDVVNGFHSGIDVIDLTGFGGLVWQSGANFSGTAAEVRFQGELVRIDADGDGAADEVIKLDNVSFVTSDDFIL